MYETTLKDLHDELVLIRNLLLMQAAAQGNVRLKKVEEDALEQFLYEHGYAKVERKD